LIWKRYVSIDLLMLQEWQLWKTNTSSHQSKAEAHNYYRNQISRIALVHTVRHHPFKFAAAPRLSMGFLCKAAIHNSDFVLPEMSRLTRSKLCSHVPN
jgi:hypothetical protein